MASSNTAWIRDASKDYADKTGIDLFSNPFADRLDECDSIEAVVGLLEGQVKEFEEYREGNGGSMMLINWLRPVVEVVHTLSGVIGEVVSLVPLSPAKEIFVGVKILLEAARGVTSSHGALTDLFECIGRFLSYLHINTGITLTPLMKDIIVRIMVEVLSALALATKQTMDGQFNKFANTLLGESEVEAVLFRLELLTREQVRMTGAQILDVVHWLMNNVKASMEGEKVSIDDIRQALVVMQEIAKGINTIKRDLFQREAQTWFSSPNPSDNHDIARKAYRSGTAVWFAQGRTFERWMKKGSLMWIYAGSGKSILCSTIIQEAKALCDTGLGLMAYFYFDFRDRAKQDVRGLLSSLLIQFAATSDPHFDKLSALYSAYNDALEKPNNDVLIQCLEDVLKLRGQPATYIIVDGLDECPNNIGKISPRRVVLDFVRRLASLPLPNLHICITSRPEADIWAALEPMASHIRIQKWRPEDKQLVVETLSEKADGMCRTGFDGLFVSWKAYFAAFRPTFPMP
ncbi:hypothetical protein EI94DRAFT_1030402 [Lactarius quietus]|nr:hypothetical protein EI94DRAFT_1030402 [Lactarius quietus]